MGDDETLAPPALPDEPPEPLEPRTVVLSEPPPEPEEPPRREPMVALTNISVEEAEEQARVLRKASQFSPVRHLRYQLRLLAAEWTRASKDLKAAAEVDEEACIELVGSLVAGMEVHCGRDWGLVVRTMQRDGQVSVHAELEGKPYYINCATAASPVIVRP